MLENGLNTMIPNWGSTENTVCKGYIYAAIKFFNNTYGYYDDSLNDANNFMNCLKWAFNDMTAQNAYYFYYNHSLIDFFQESINNE